jgi:hypothetical protein
MWEGKTLLGVAVALGECCMLLARETDELRFRLVGWRVLPVPGACGVLSEDMMNYHKPYGETTR